MPVLDANALKTDPQGAAFLLGVLRQPNQARPGPQKVAPVDLRLPCAAKPREWRMPIVPAL